MKLGAIAAALTLTACLLPQQAFAVGALAVGVPPDVSKDGFAYGMSADKDSDEAASTEAVTSCNGTNPNSHVYSQSSGPARSLCTLVQTFRHQCAVVAEDPAAGTPGIGWAIAPTLETATEQALANCRATAGASRTQFCARDSYSCDTK